MDVRAHFLEPFLVVHAKALFLVHDQKPKVLEPHPLGQKRMRADHDIDAAIGQPCAGVLGLFLAHEARELPHIDRKTAKAVREGLGMLARQKRGGRNHRNLKP